MSNVVNLANLENQETIIKKLGDQTIIAKSVKAVYRGETMAKPTNPRPTSGSGYGKYVDVIHNIPSGIDISKSILICENNLPLPKIAGEYQSQNIETYGLSNQGIYYKLTSRGIEAINIKINATSDNINAALNTSIFLVWQIIEFY